jgi:hypothetical protein
MQRKILSAHTVVKSWQEEQSAGVLLAQRKTLQSDEA